MSIFMCLTLIKPKAAMTPETKSAVAPPQVKTPKKKGTSEKNAPAAATAVTAPSVGMC